MEYEPYYICRTDIDLDDLPRLLQDEEDLLALEDLPLEKGMNLLSKKLEKHYKNRYVISLEGSNDLIYILIFKKHVAPFNRMKNINCVIHTSHFDDDDDFDDERYIRSDFLNDKGYITCRFIDKDDDRVELSFKINNNIKDLLEEI